MKSELVQYSQAHAYEIFDKGVREAKFLLTAIGDWESAAKFWETAGPAYTLLVDGEAQGCGGIAKLTNNIGECWILIPESKYGTLIYRSILLKLRELTKEHQYRRLQALVVSGFCLGKRTLELLGFEYEGTLRKFGPSGEDFLMYSKVN